MTVLSHLTEIVLGLLLGGGVVAVLVAVRQPRRSASAGLRAAADHPGTTRLLADLHREDGAQ